MENSKTSKNLNRLDYLLKYKIPFLKEKLFSKEKIDLTDQKIIETLCACDPSKNKSAVQWLIDSYLRDGFLWEDCLGEQTSKIFETLVWFSTNNLKLPKKDRSLYNYKTVGDLYSSVEDFINLNDYKQADNESKGQKRGLEQSKARTQSFVLSEDKIAKTIIVVPKTKFAAQWWGQGTRWCTAAENNNMFDRYNKQAPLVIFIVPKKDKNSIKELESDNKLKSGVEKFQLWMNSNKSEKIQFMNSSDQSISIDSIKEYWNVFEPVITRMLSMNYKIFNFIPKKFINKQIAQTAIKQNGCLLNEIPKQLVTKKLCLLAFSNNLYSLCYFPEKYVTYDMCEQAIRANSDIFKFIPKKLIDLNLCRIALGRNGYALESVPVELHSNELYLLALKTTGGAIRHIPEEKLNQELCTLAMKTAGFLLDRVPKHFRNKETCLNAISNCAGAGVIKYVPLEILDNNLCCLAVKKHPNSIEYIPETMKTIEVCTVALMQDKNNHIVRKYIPEHLLKAVEEYVEINSVNREWKIDILDGMYTNKLETAQDNKNDSLQNDDQQANHFKL